MAQAARKTSRWIASSTPATPSLVAAGPECAPSPSPARALQDQLAAALASNGAPEPHVTPWPGAVRLLVLGGLTVGSWAALLAGARSLFHLAHAA